MPRRRFLTSVAAATLAMTAACGGGGDDDPTLDSLPPEATTTTSTPPDTEPAQEPPPETAPPAEGMAYGDTCTRGSHPDCIDPEGDGSHTYLEGGAACMATFTGNESLCSDLDEDGRAGYPDSG